MNDDIIIPQDEIDAIRKKHNITPIRDLDIEGYEGISCASMSSDHPTPLEYIFYPCLPTKGICFIYAAAGVGKTLFTLNLSYAIAMGGQFLKYTVPFPRKVLYVDGEMQYTLMHKRIMDIQKEQGKLIIDNFFLMNQEKIKHRMPKLDTEEGQYIYHSLIEKGEYDVIVWDNLACLSTMEKGSPKRWPMIQDFFLNLRKEGRTSLIVHHAGKDKMGYRGDSCLLDVADCAISLQSVSDDSLEEEGNFTKKMKVVYQKSRIFGGKEVLPYEISFAHGTWNYYSVELTMLDKVVERIEMKMTQSEIAKEFNVSRPYINKLVKKAKKIGKLI